MITQIHKHELLTLFKSYLTTHGYSSPQIYMSVLVVRRVLEFMDINCHDYFDENVANLYNEYLQNSDNKEWKKLRDPTTVRRICDFLNGLPPSSKPKYKIITEFVDRDCDIKNKFLHYLREDRMFSERTCHLYYSVLNDFTQWQDINNVVLIPASGKALFAY